MKYNNKTYFDDQDQFVYSGVLYREVYKMIEPYLRINIPQTSDNQLQAKKALLQVLSFLRQNPIPDLQSISLLLYLRQLEKVYFRLIRGDYCGACNEIKEALHEYGTKETYHGLIYLLEKMENGTLPCTKGGI